MSKNMYFTLDEAREEIKKRWNDVELKKRIEDELGDKFIPSFKDNPRGVTFKQVCSPDNGFLFFFQCSKYVNVDPLILEYHDDMFVSFNEEKKGLGRLRITKDDGRKAVADIMNFHDNEKKKIGECVLKTGENLVAFHRNLFKVSGYDLEFFEISQWSHDIGKAKEYYYYFLLHFIAHGILFETFLDESDTNEDAFTNEIIIPSIKKIKENIGAEPIVVRSFPANQTDNEDFYWWSYPPNINRYIIEYAEKNNLTFKEI